MVQIDLAAWMPIYGGAIIAIGFSFFASILIQTVLREQELKIRLGKMTNQEALEKTSKLSMVAGVLFLSTLIVIGACYAIIFYINVPSSPTGNVTNICENCSYPVTNIINNNNVTVTAVCEKNMNTSLSIKELKYLVGKRRV